MDLYKDVELIISELGLEVLTKQVTDEVISISTSECIILVEEDEIQIAFSIAVEPARAATIATKFSELADVVIQDSYVLGEHGIYTGEDAKKVFYTQIADKVIKVFIEEQKELHRFLFSKSALG